MAKIHGLVYIATGLLVSVLSYKLDYQKFIYFFYIGLIFVFIGAVKIIFGLIKRKTSRTGKQIKLHHQAQNIKYCTKCGNALRLHDMFCGRCGNRI